MRRLLILTTLPLALAACDSGTTVTATNASMTEVAEAARGAVKLEPGKWRHTVSFVSADAPGLPAGMAEMMTKQMSAASNSSNESCVTPEMANKPSGEMFGGTDKGQCRYETFEMGGGRIDAVMLCKTPGENAGEVRMAMAGTFTGSRFDTTSEMKMNIPGATPQGTPMTIKTRMVGERIGACDAPKAG